VAIPWEEIKKMSDGMKKMSDKIGKMSDVFRGFFLQKV